MYNFFLFICLFVCTERSWIETKVKPRWNQIGQNANWKFRNFILYNNPVKVMRQIITILKND